MDTLVAGGLLRRVANLHAQLQRQGESCCGGATMAQCTILTALGRTGPVTLGDLSRTLGLDKGWVSRSVETLTQEGLLEKTPSEVDKRTVIIAMTESGQSLCQSVDTALDALSESVLKRIPADKHEEVERTLTLLLLALEEALSEGSRGSGCC